VLQRLQPSDLHLPDLQNVHMPNVQNLQMPNVQNLPGLQNLKNALPAGLPSYAPNSPAAASSAAGTTH
jgi:hypothetical protein